MNYNTEVGFPLSDAMQREQATLSEQGTRLNAEATSITDDEDALKRTPVEQWHRDHSKAMEKIADRKAALMRESLGLCQAIEKFLATALAEDYPAARSAAQDAERKARQDATAHLVAGGWTDGTYLLHGTQHIGITPDMLARNAHVREAMLKAQALSESPLREARKVNGREIVRLKAQFAAVKSRAMALAT